MGPELVFSQICGEWIESLGKKSIKSKVTGPLWFKISKKTAQKIVPNLYFIAGASQALIFIYFALKFGRHQQIYIR